MKKRRVFVVATCVILFCLFRANYHNFLLTHEHLLAYQRLLLLNRTIWSIDNSSIKHSDISEKGHGDVSRSNLVTDDNASKMEERNLLSDIDIASVFKINGSVNDSEQLPDDFIKINTPVKLTKIDRPEVLTETDEPDESIEYDMPGEPSKTGVLEESIAVNDPDESFKTGVPKESIDLNVPDESIETGVPEESIAVNDPDESIKTGVLEESIVVNVPGELIKTGVPEESIAVNVPDQSINTSVLEDSTTIDQMQKSSENDVPQTFTARNEPEKSIEQGVPGESINNGVLKESSKHNLESSMTAVPEVEPIKADRKEESIEINVPKVSTKTEVSEESIKTGESVKSDILEKSITSVVKEKSIAVGYLGQSTQTRASDESIKINVPEVPIRQPETIKKQIVEQSVVKRSHNFKLIWDVQKLKDEINHCYGKCKFISLPRRRGRMGNNMFQIASMIGTAKDLDLVPVIGTKFVLNKYFKLPNVIDIEIMNEQTCIERGYGVFSPCRGQSIPMGNTSFSGFRQSWKYFVNEAASIKTIFKFRPTFLDGAASFHKSLFKPNYKIIGIHVRRGDITAAKRRSRGNAVAEDGFYRNAMKYYTNLHNFVTFVILSDDKKWCKENIRGPNIMYSPFKDPGIDMALMTLFDGMILTYGTFGWWGAWLSGKPAVYFWENPRPGSRGAMNRHRDDYYPRTWIPMSN
ncbi:hypothetical protein ACF0H5_023202 [Mactra antiquata]